MVSTILLSKGFTFICPTELAAFGDLNQEFQDRDAQLLAGNADSEFVHWAWHKHQEELRDLPYPLLMLNENSPRH